MSATFYIASLPFQDTPRNGGYRTLCLRPTTTIRDASQVASHRPGAATASIPAPAWAQRRRPTNGRASNGLSRRVASGAHGERRV